MRVLKARWMNRVGGCVVLVVLGERKIGVKLKRGFGMEGGNRLVGNPLAGKPQESGGRLAAGWGRTDQERSNFTKEQPEVVGGGLVV